jgi:hypothetical protein
MTVEQEKENEFEEENKLLRAILREVIEFEGLQRAYKGTHFRACQAEEWVDGPTGPIMVGCNCPGPKILLTIMEEEA